MNAVARSAKPDTWWSTVSVRDSEASIEVMSAGAVSSRRETLADSASSGARLLAPWRRPGGEVAAHGVELGGDGVGTPRSAPGVASLSSSGVIPLRRFSRVGGGNRQGLVELGAAARQGVAEAVDHLLEVEAGRAG